MFRNRAFLAVTGGHFAIDILNSSGAVLLAALSSSFGLSYGQLGVALTAYYLIGSLSQPFFGLLADRLPTRTMLLVGISILWMAGCYALVALAPTWTLMLPCFLLAALGSALFHPIGTATAAAAAPEQAGRATAIFFFSGQMGLASGPIFVGWLAGRAGAVGMLPLALFALIPAAFAFASISAVNLPVKRAAAAAAPTRNWSALAVSLIVAFILLVALRSSLQQVFSSFLPKLYDDRGWEPKVYGLLTGVFMGAAAIGNIVTGDIADRFGMRMATVVPLLLGIPASLVCLINMSLPVTFIACALAGFLIGGQHSVLVLHAQRLLPAKQGFAAGLILGFTFASGTLGTWSAGYLADQVGLETTMIWITLLGLPAALLALTLPGRDRRTAPKIAATASAD